jgi:hypothetical protein
MKPIIRLLLFFAVLFAASCSQPSDMLTVINSDGSCYREFTENADDAFLSGNLSAENNPFPVAVDSTWEFVWSFRGSKLRTDFPLSKAVVDSIDKIVADQVRIAGRLSKEHVIVFARRHYKSVEELDSTLKLKNSTEWSKIRVKHCLDKKFRWFYTYYDYRETYAKSALRLEIPIEEFMTKDEALFWFTGTPNLLRGMNGPEIRSYLGQIEDKYNKWITLNVWNAEYKVLLESYNGIDKKPVSKLQLQSLRDSIYNSKITTLDNFDMEKALNSFFKTHVFSELWKDENTPLKKFEKNLDKQFSFLFSPAFNYKLIMPGEVTQAGNALVHGDTLVWELSSYQLIPADYIIEAQSRRANVWAFILTGLIVIVAAGSFVCKPRKS